MVVSKHHYCEIERRIYGMKEIWIAEESCDLVFNIRRSAFRLHIRAQYVQHFLLIVEEKKCKISPKYFIRAYNLVNELKNGLEGITLYPSKDWTKFAVDFKPLGISPYLAEEIFQKKGIYPEFNDGRYILFYLSPSVEPFHINEFKNTLLWVCAQKKLQGTYKDVPSVPTADRTYSFLYAYRQKTEWLPLKQAVGKMCADNAGITPPCLPVVIAGEMIGQQAVDVLSKAKNTFGIVDGKIKVVKR